VTQAAITDKMMAPLSERHPALGAAATARWVSESVAGSGCRRSRTSPGAHEPASGTLNRGGISSVQPMTGVPPIPTIDCSPGERRRDGSDTGRHAASPRNVEMGQGVEKSQTARSYRFSSSTWSRRRSFER